MLTPKKIKNNYLCWDEDLPDELPDIGVGELAGLQSHLPQAAPAAVPAATPVSGEMAGHTPRKQKVQQLQHS